MNVVDEGWIFLLIFDEVVEWLVCLQDSGCIDDMCQVCVQWWQCSLQYVYVWECVECLL